MKKIKRMKVDVEPLRGSICESVRMLGLLLKHGGTGVWVAITSTQEEHQPIKYSQSYSPEGFYHKQRA